MRMEQFVPDKQTYNVASKLRKLDHKTHVIKGKNVFHNDCIRTLPSH